MTAELPPADAAPAVKAGTGTNREAFRIPAFRRLALAWVCSNFGDSALYLTTADRKSTRLNSSHWE